jgi:hypothetical protein
MEINNFKNIIMVRKDTELDKKILEYLLEIPK